MIFPWMTTHPDRLHRRAADLRHAATRAEKRLLRALKETFPHIAWRSQYVIAPYIVDICAPDIKLVIEADGSQHAESPTDKKRDKRLQKQGYTVLRFWNNDIMENLEGVLHHVSTHIPAGT